MEVDNSFLPEFEGTGKKGIRKLGSIGKEELKYRPYYPANISRQRRVVGDSNITFPGTGTKKPKVVEKKEGTRANKSYRKEPVIELLRIICLELIKTVLLGRLLILQVAVVAISGAGK